MRGFRGQRRGNPRRRNFCFYCTILFPKFQDFRRILRNFFPFSDFFRFSAVFYAEILPVNARIYRYFSAKSFGRASALRRFIPLFQSIIRRLLAINKDSLPLFHGEFQFGIALFHLLGRTAELLGDFPQSVARAGNEYGYCTIVFLIRFPFFDFRNIFRRRLLIQLQRHLQRSFRLRFPLAALADDQAADGGFRFGDIAFLEFDGEQEGQRELRAAVHAVRIAENDVRKNRAFRFPAVLAALARNLRPRQHRRLQRRGIIYRNR